MSAGTAHAEDWHFGLTPYLWLPNIEANGTADAPPNSGEPAYEIGPINYLDNLDFVLMLAGEARSGSWSLRSDLIYLDFTNQRSAVKNVSRPSVFIRQQERPAKNWTLVQPFLSRKERHADS